MHSNPDLHLVDCNGLFGAERFCHFGYIDSLLAGADAQVVYPQIGATAVPHCRSRTTPFFTLAKMQPAQQQLWKRGTW